MSSDTIFHKIVAKQTPAYIIWEDDNYLAFLDIFPTHEGQTLVVPKTEARSKFSSVEQKLMSGLINAAQAVAKLLEKKLDNVERCQVVIEGFEIDYLHVKLLPAYLPTPEKFAVHHGGNRAEDSTLKTLQNKIIN